MSLFETSDFIIHHDFKKVSSLKRLQWSRLYTSLIPALCVSGLGTRLAIHTPDGSCNEVFHVAVGDVSLHISLAEEVMEAHGQSLRGQARELVWCVCGNSTTEKTKSYMYHKLHKI